jgi:hypothetical protein
VTLRLISISLPSASLAFTVAPALTGTPNSLATLPSSSDRRVKLSF